MGSFAVIWAGKYGTAERYAGWLEQALEAQVLPVDGLREEALAAFDTVILVSAIQAGRIRGLGRLKRNASLLKGKRLYVLAVGISPATPGVVESTRTANMRGTLADVPLFYARGAWDMAAMRPADRAVCRLLLRMVNRKDPDTLDEMSRPMVNVGTGPIDCTDKEYLLPLMDRVIKDQAGEGKAYG